MKFLDVVEKLQKENEGSVVLIRNGNGVFFTAYGNDAVALHEALGLNVTCAKPGMCKVGFQVKSIEKYIKMLEEKNKSFVVFLKNGESIEELYKFDGEKSCENRICLDCNNCVNRKEDENDILERIRNRGKKQ